MINLTHAELAEIKNDALPTHGLDNLKSMRNQLCESAQQASFTLQSQQKFLRRVLSPDSPARNLLMVHGTGTGKTCTAIQIAEEYILRPEFQDKKVMVVASAAVEANFRTQLFEMNRVNIDVVAGTLESKQCTGRRYLDMLLRIENEPKNWANPDVRDRLQTTANRIISEFYEFAPYETFGNTLTNRIGASEKAVDRAWIRETFDNRLLIIDEAHNIRESGEGLTIKGITRGLERLVKNANGLVVVLMTATPMFDTYDEMGFFMNLFLWNDRRQKPEESVKMLDFFNEDDGTLKTGDAGQRFRDWCQDYVSFIRGENPFTFPFRLPPPKVVDGGLQRDFFGENIGNEKLRYLQLVASSTQGVQKELLTRTDRKNADERRQAIMESTIAVTPENKPVREVFTLVGSQYKYVKEPFLTPTELPNYSAKFASVLQSIENGTGIVFVYSNYVAMGARLFSMALEEHGYTPAMGQPLLVSNSYTGAPKGKYIFLSSDASESEITKMIALSKSPKNATGDLVRVIVASRIVSEGVDFKYVRQIHILDPWWNMSRTEQVIGRGLRTCSHQLLPFLEQNCTVYLHVVRTDDGKECYDEFTYRTRVEPKAMRIANVRKVMTESAMDCPLQTSINTLPTEWKRLDIPQIRSEGGHQDDMYKLYTMLAPTFDEEPDVTRCVVKNGDNDSEHTRPLSTYLDVRDELLVKLGRLLVDKPIWDREQLVAALRPYTPEVALFNIQQAISSGFRFKDSFGRAALLESKGDLYALAPIGVPNATIVERTTQTVSRERIPLTQVAEEETKEEPVAIESTVLDDRRRAFQWPKGVVERFDESLLNGYIFDHTFSDAERRAYLKSKPTNLPFAKQLFVSDDLFVLGNDEFDPPEVPVGTAGAQYRAWNATLLKRFIDAKDKLFASVKLKDKKFVISKTKPNPDGTLRRDIDKTQKKFDPIVCGSGEYDKGATLELSKFIDPKGVGVPATLKRDDICVYTELLARENATLPAETRKIEWFTPEELSILYKKDSENKQAFTTAFKK
jgi:hypothetical protein